MQISATSCQFTRRIDHDSFWPTHHADQRAFRIDFSAAHARALGYMLSFYCFFRHLVSLSWLGQGLPIFIPFIATLAFLLDKHDILIGIIFHFNVFLLFLLALLL